MRPWISLMLLATGLVTAGAMPAAADNMTMRSRDVVRSGRLQTPGLHHRFLRPDAMFGPFAFGAPLILPGGYFAGGGASGTPVIMLSEAPAMAAPPPPPPPAIEQRPSVETTAEGVVVVRGPGSHHLGY
jgi:hypothetical protein